MVEEEIQFNFYIVSRLEPIAYYAGKECKSKKKTLVLSKRGSNKISSENMAMHAEPCCSQDTSSNTEFFFGMSGLPTVCHDFSWNRKTILKTAK